MKVGLIDIDSKIPNLALMKLSACWKNKGASVDLISPLFARADNYDLILASKVFNDTPVPILPEGCDIGGTGVDLITTLSDEAEHIYPDYDLYNCGYAIGFTSRGCNRKCSFCVVPQKEGKWKAVAEIHEFWRGQDRIMLLDNSMNTDESHFVLTLEHLERAGVAVDFSQGLDIRYLTDYQALCLKRIRLWKQIHFAWDSMGIEKLVRRGIGILEKHKLKYRSMFYVLIGCDTTPEEDLYRVETLRGLGVDPFVMPFNRSESYQREFARWVNHKAIFKSVDWEDYRP